VIITALRGLLVRGSEPDNGHRYGLQQKPINPEARHIRTQPVGLFRIELTSRLPVRGQAVDRAVQPPTDGRSVATGVHKRTPDPHTASRRRGLVASVAVCSGGRMVGS
jgi:hypothetical protein